MAAMTYESIVAAVRKKLSKADVSSIPGTLAFQVDVEGKAEGIFYIEIKDGQLQEVRPVLCFRDFGKNPISFFLFSQKVLETTGKYCIM